MFLINFYYKMDRNKIRSVLMTPSTHNTQQTFAQSYKKKWVANEDFIECKLILFGPESIIIKIFGRRMDRPWDHCRTLAIH